MQLDQLAGAEGRDVRPGVPVPPAQPREGPLAVNRGASTAVIFLSRHNESH